MMQDVMVDIETLDTRNSAVILSIGAVRFNAETDAMDEKFYATISIDSSLALGRTISGSTLSWWLTRDAEARNAIVHSTHLTMYEALNRFKRFLRHGDKLWGNGVAFDNSILASAYAACDIPLPWGYQNDRCYRTMKAIFPGVPKPQFEGVKHNALADACNQARHLQAIFRYINGIRNESA